jgi:hypothetical protein
VGPGGFEVDERERGKGEHACAIIYLTNA